MKEHGVAWWKCKNDTDDILVDELGIYNGTVKGAKLIDTSIGKARRFEGGSNIIEFNSIVIPKTGACSIRFKMMIPEIPTSLGRILSTRNTTAENGIYIIIKETGDIEVALFDVGNPSTSVATLRYPFPIDGQWHDIGIIWSDTIKGSDVKLYIDNMSTPVKETFTSNPISFNMANVLRIGNVSQLNQGLVGDITQVEIFNSVIDFSKVIYSNNKYLIKSQNKVNTLFEGVWTDITENIIDIDNITQEEYKQYGMKFLEDVPIDFINQLKEFEVLAYSKDDENPKLELTVDEYKPIMTLDDPEIVTLTDSNNPLLHIEGYRDLRPYCKSDVKNLLIQSSIEPNMKITSVPKPQLIKPKDDIVFRELSKVLDFQVIATESNEGRIRIIFSIDSGATWMTYNEATQDFVEINEQDLDEVEENGIKISVLNSIKEKWGDIVTKGKVRFAYYLKIDNLSDTAEIDELIATLNILGFWESTIHEEDYDYRYDNVTIYIELYRDGSYKINYTE